MLRKLTTNKLFFDKWPYKITCKIQGAFLLRSYKLSYLLSLSGDPDEYQNHKWSTYHRNIDVKNLQNFIKLVQPFVNDIDIKKRIDSSSISFYVLNLEKFTEITNILQPFVVSVTTPLNDDDLKKLKDNINYTLCDNLPHKKYKYKITFKEMPANVRLNLIKWAEKYSNDDIYITKATRQHFNCLKSHYKAHYFYVKDEKMITLIMMASSGYIRRTDKFVTREFSVTV